MLPLLVALLLSFVPAFVYCTVLYWLDRHEKEPLWLIAGVFAWGALVATIGAIIFGTALETIIYVMTTSEEVSGVFGAVLIAPLVEESLKGLAVLLVFLFLRRELDSVLDGIVYAGMAGLGFAATENVLYLLGAGYGEDGWAGMFVLFFLRVILGAWGHAVYAAFIGIGLAVARLSTKGMYRFLAPLAGWALAVFVHMLHNGMAVFLGQALGLGGLVAMLLIDWLSWLVMLAIIYGALRAESRWHRTYLREERDQGIITPAQYAVAGSTRRQMGTRLRGLFTRSKERLFYQLAAELAQKKYHFYELNEQDERTRTTIERLRQQLRKLSPSVPTS